MADFPALPLWTDAYLADTLDLRAEEHGCYLLILFIAWRRQDCAIPNDMEWLKRSLSGCIAGMHGNKFNSIIPKLLLRFFTLGEDGKWHQKKLRKVRDFQLILSRKNSESAKKRWHKDGESNGYEMPSDSARYASSSSSSSTIPPNPPKGGRNRYANGKTRNGSNGHAAIGIIATEEHKWRARLQSFKKSGAWMIDLYGPKPGEPECAAPKILVSEILGG